MHNITKCESFYQLIKHTHLKDYLKFSYLYICSSYLLSLQLCYYVPVQNLNMPIDIVKLKGDNYVYILPFLSRANVNKAISTHIKILRRKDSLSSD